MEVAGRPTIRLVSYWCGSGREANNTTSILLVWKWQGGQQYDEYLIGVEVAGRPTIRLVSYWCGSDREANNTTSILLVWKWQGG